MPEQTHHLSSQKYRENLTHRHGFLQKDGFLLPFSHCLFGSTGAQVILIPWLGAVFVMYTLL